MPGGGDVARRVQVWQVVKLVQGALPGAAAAAADTTTRRGGKEAAAGRK